MATVILETKPSADKWASIGHSLCIENMCVDCMRYGWALITLGMTRDGVVTILLWPALAWVVCCCPGCISIWQPPWLIKHGRKSSHKNAGPALWPYHSDIYISITKIKNKKVSRKYHLTRSKVMLLHLLCTHKSWNSHPNRLSINTYWVTL